MAYVIPGLEPAHHSHPVAGHHTHIHTCTTCTTYITVTVLGGQSSVRCLVQTPTLHTLALTSTCHVLSCPVPCCRFPVRSIASVYQSRAAFSQPASNAAAFIRTPSLDRQQAINHHATGPGNSVMFRTPVQSSSYYTQHLPQPLGSPRLYAMRDCCVQAQPQGRGQQLLGRNITSTTQRLIPVLLLLSMEPCSLAANTSRSKVPTRTGQQPLGTGALCLVFKTRLYQLKLLVAPGLERLPSCLALLPARPPFIGLAAGLAVVTQRLHG